MTNRAPITIAAGQRAGSPNRIGFTFTVLVVTMLLASLNQTIFSAALPTIVGDLNGVDHIMWVTTAYMLTSTIMLPVYGKVGDLIGRKGLLLTAIALFLLGSILGGLAQDMSWLISGRAVQGLGGGGLMILAQSIIADVVPARERGKYTGVMGGAFALSSVAGPLLGGWFTEDIGWRWAFWINIPLGVLAMISAIFFLRLPKTSKGRPKLDFIGMGLLAITSAALILVATWGGTTYQWNSPAILSLIAVTAVAGAAFIFIERRAAEPIMPLHLLRDRNFLLTTIAGLITGIAMFGALAYLPTYLQMVTGAGPTAAGFLMIPQMAALLIASIVSGHLVSRFGRYKWLPVAGWVLVAIALFLMSTMNPSLQVWILCSYLAIMGLGWGMGQHILVLIVQNSFPLSQVGTATSSNNYFRQIGAALGAAVVGSVFVAKLAALLTERRSDLGGDAVPGLNSLTPTAVRDLPASVRDGVVTSYNDALTPVFLYMVPVVLVAAVLLLFVKEKPLATALERDLLPDSLEIDGTNMVIPASRHEPTGDASNTGTRRTA